MKTINLTQNKVAIIDDEDFHKVNTIKWYAGYNKDTKSFYACNTVNFIKENGERSSHQLRIHRFILDVENSDVQVDHKMVIRWITEKKI